METEFKKVLENDFSLSFRYPTREQVRKIRRARDDLSQLENPSAGEVQRNLLDIVKMVEDGTVTAEDFPKPLVDEIHTLLRRAAS